MPCAPNFGVSMPHHIHKKMEEELEIKIAEEIINTKLKKLSVKYGIDPIEVYINYLEHWKNINTNNIGNINNITVIYNALDKTIGQYNNIVKYKNNKQLEFDF